MKSHRLLDLCASLLYLASRRAPGERALPYTLPAAVALARAIRLGARGERVADLRAALAQLDASARREVAA